MKLLFIGILMIILATSSFALVPRQDYPIVGDCSEVSSLGENYILIYAGGKHMSITYGEPYPNLP